MRILVTSDQWSPDVVGGSARVAADMARTLAARGHDVVAIVPEHTGSPMVEIEEETGVEVHRVLRRRGLPRTLVDPASVALHARRLGRFDIVVAHQPSNALGAAAALRKTPLALVFHASIVLEGRFDRARSKLSRRARLLALEPVFVAQERQALRRAAGILVLSRFSEDLVRRRSPASAPRVHVVRGAAPEEFFRVRRDPSSLRARYGIPAGILLLTARRLEPRMGLELLLDAFTQLEDDRLVLAIAGTGSLRCVLEEQIAHLGLQERVRLLGHVPDHELPNLYAAADLFVLPSVAYEGFGMATVEALATGTPVLGTAVGATPEILAGLGDEFLVNELRSDLLAFAISRLAPLLGEDLRQRARALAEARYRWPSVIGDWEQALHQIANN